MYILATFLRTLDYNVEDDHAGYNTYRNMREYLWNLRTSKFCGMWRREACFTCNGVGCSLHRSLSYMTTVIVLCELTPEVITVLNREHARGAHRMKTELFDSLSSGNAAMIAKKVKRYFVKQRMSKNSEDRNNQCRRQALKMDESEYDGNINGRWEFRARRPTPEEVLQDPLFF